MCCRVNQLMSSPVSNSWAREYMSQHDYSFYKDKTNCLTAQSPKIVILFARFICCLMPRQHMFLCHKPVFGRHSWF